MMTWPRGLSFLRFQIYLSEKPGTSSPLWRNKAGDPRENERLIQKPEQERPGELLASPPSAFWPHFCSPSKTASQAGPACPAPCTGETSKGPNQIRSGLSSLSSCRQNTFRGFSPAAQFEVWLPCAMQIERSAHVGMIPLELVWPHVEEFNLDSISLISSLFPLSYFPPVAESSFSIPFCDM